MKFRISFFFIISGLTYSQPSFSQRMINVQLFSSQPTELQAYAGEDVYWDGTSVVLGGTNSALGGTAPYEFDWSPITALDNPYAANPQIISSPDAQYILNVIDGRGCSASDSVLTISSNLHSVASGYVKIFPNPSNHSVLIEIDNTINGLFDVIVYNEMGELVETLFKISSGKNLMLDISSYPDGIYNVVIQSEFNTATSKLLVIKKQ